MQAETTYLYSREIGLSENILTLISYMNLNSQYENNLLEGVENVKTRAHLIISGEVQGVMFRQETKHRALNSNVKGWVRNRYDGTVEAVFEGEEQDVESMITFCKRGPPRAIVTSVQVEMEEYVGEFDRFSVI